MLQLNSAGDLDKYAWPIYYLDRDNSVLCPECATKSFSDKDEVPAFKPIEAGINYEDADLYCDQCNARIESAYAETV